MHPTDVLNAVEAALQNPQQVERHCMLDHVRKHASLFGRVKCSTTSELSGSGVRGFSPGHGYPARSIEIRWLMMKIKGIFWLRWAR